MAASIIRARRILILLKEGADAEPQVCAAWPSGQPANERIMLSKTMLDEILNGRESLLVTDAQLDPRFRGHASIVAQQIRSALGAPLFDNERVLG
jgi:GAF domain-containing protein